MTFHCEICLNSFPSAEAVYEHWLQNHISDDKTEPFGFHVADLVSCFHCGQPGAYEELQAHHIQNHSNKQFTVVDLENEKKCALCAFVGAKLVEHARVEHDFILKGNISNPIALSDKQMKELNKIDLRQKVKCNTCKKIFETDNDFDKHYKQWHSDQPRKPVRKFKEDYKLYVPCCNQTIDESKFNFHFQNHQWDFVCDNCGASFPSIAAIIEHDSDVHDTMNAMEKHYDEYKKRMKLILLNTKVLCANGLVVRVQNLMTTEYRKKIPNVDDFLCNLVKVKQEKNA